MKKLMLLMMLLMTSTAFATSQAGYWKFDVNGSALDSSGNGNNGTVSGPVFTTDGKFGGAYIFDGYGDYIQAAYSPSLNITGNMTISLWAKINKNISLVFVNKPTYHQQYAFGVEADGKLSMNWRAPDVQAGSADTPLPSSYIGAWHMYSVVVNCSGAVNGIMTFYIDGIANGSRSFNVNQCIGAVSSYTTGALRIGMRSTDQSNNFTGSMDEVRIYNRPLSAAEIQDIYTQSPLSLVVISPYTRRYVTDIDLIFFANNNPVSCWYSLNSTNYTVTGCNNGTITRPVPDGNYPFSLFVTDNESNTESFDAVLTIGVLGGSHAMNDTIDMMTSSFYTLSGSNAMLAFIVLGMFTAVMVMEGIKSAVMIVVIFPLVILFSLAGYLPHQVFVMAWLLIGCVLWYLLKSR